MSRSPMGQVAPSGGASQSEEGSGLKGVNYGRRTVRFSYCNPGSTARPWCDASLLVTVCDSASPDWSAVFVKVSARCSAGANRAVPLCVFVCVFVLQCVCVEMHVDARRRFCLKRRKNLTSGSKGIEPTTCCCARFCCHERRPIT